MAEEPGLAVSVIAVHWLAGSLISTCYDYQLRRERNGSVDLKPTIDYLRSLSDIIHTMVYDADSNGHLLSSSTSNLLNKADGPLVQCTTELRTLERILEASNWPPSDTELTNTLKNLNRIKAELDVRRSTAPGDISVLRENSTSNIDAHYTSTIQGGRKVQTENYFTNNIDAR